jgi:hypothetical protein
MPTRKDTSKRRKVCGNTSCDPITSIECCNDTSRNICSDSGSSHITTSMTTRIFIWELPDTLLYEIAKYCVPSTQRASFLCHKIAILCKSAHKVILDDTKTTEIWNAVLNGDYGVANDTTGDRHHRRRSCKRLHRSLMDQVRDAHKLMKDNTEIAYFYLWELSSISGKTPSKSAKNSLTRMNLIRIFNTYGPHLMYNMTMSSGGTFLVEVCRCRNVKSATTILQCVKELVENRGAMVNKSTAESANASLTPLCVAAVRGMPKVVDYLLSEGASTSIPCSGRFRLHTNPKRSLRCNSVTALQFAEAMITAELEEGAKSTDLKDLRTCIKLLQEENR